MSSKTYDGKHEAKGVLLFFLGVAMMLMFYLPAEVTGTLGDIVKKFGFGLLGFMAYSIPFSMLTSNASPPLVMTSALPVVKSPSVILYLPVAFISYSGLRPSDSE